MKICLSHLKKNFRAEKENVVSSIYIKIRVRKVHTYIYIYVYMYICIYVYMYIDDVWP